MENSYKSLLRLALPIIVSQVGIILVMFADNIMIGRYSTASLASVSFVNNLFNTANMCVMGFTYGVTPLIGVLFARKQHSQAGETVRNALLLNILFSLAVMAVMGTVFLNLDRFNLPPHLLPIIRPYYLITLAGLIPIAVFNVFAQWSYAINNSSMPMWILLGANALNVLGNYLLIYGNFGFPELGLTGAGISTITARLLCMALIAAYFFRKKEAAAYADGYRGGKASGKMMKRILKTSFPVALQLGLESGAFSFGAVVTGKLGEIPLASYQVIVIVGTLGFCIYYSIGSAISVLVSNAKGKEDSGMMRSIAWKGYHIMLFFAAMASMIFVFAGKHLIMLISPDPAVIALTLTLIFPLVLYQLGDATQITFANALRGTGNVMPMIWIAFVCYFVVGAPATWIMAITAGAGIYGVILSFSVSLFLAGGLFLWFFLKNTES